MVDPVNWRLSIPGGASSHHVRQTIREKCVQCTKLRTVALSGRQKSSDLQKAGFQVPGRQCSNFNSEYNSNRPQNSSPRQKQQARCMHQMSGGERRIPLQVEASHDAIDEHEISGPYQGSKQPQDTKTRQWFCLCKSSESATLLHTISAPISFSVLVFEWR